MAAASTLTTPVRRSRAGVTFSAYFLLSGAASAVLFLYMLVPAHVLSRGDFGLFSALFGLVILLGAVFSAVQTWVAGIVAADVVEFGDTKALRRRVLGWCALLAGGFAAVSPLSARIMDAPMLSVALIGVIAVLTLVFAAVLGVLQGRQRFVALGVVNLAQALLRLIALAVTLWTGNIELMLGATAASMVPAIGLALAAVRSRRQPAARTAPGPVGARAATRRQDRLSVGPALVVAFVVGFPSVGDLVLVRALHPAEDAGDYAVVAMIGRVLIFVAVIVNTVAYPQFVTHARSVNAGRSLLVRVGAITVGMVLVGLLPSIIAPHLIVSLAAGSPSELATELLPGYAIAAALFAVGSVGSYYQLARGNLRYIFGFLVPVLAILVILTIAVPGLTELVVWLNVTALTILAVNIALVLVDILRKDAS